MPIQMVDQNTKLPVIGKIRLGIRKEAKSGAQYPSTVEHFVLKDAPEVAKIYGEDPKELDVMFPSDDLEAIIPTWLKWYAGGVKGKDGNIIGGRLQCYGDGPDLSGKPGTAHFLAKRDPITRVVPTRPCLGAKCPDAFDRNGNHQCKQSMRVFVILPLVSWFGVYQIDTTSWNSISSFTQQIRWVKELNNGVVRFVPFKITREEKATSFFDKSGKEQTGRQYIMMLKSNQTFFDKYGDEMKNKVALAFNRSSQFLLPSKQEALEAPMEDHYPVTAEEKTALPTPDQSAESLAKDPEVEALFSELEKLTGKAIPLKGRIIAIRKKEGESDVKAAVVAALQQKIAETARAGTPVQAPEPVAAPAPEVNAAGLI